LRVLSIIGIFQQLTAKLPNNLLTITRQLRESQRDLRDSNIHTSAGGFRWRVAAMENSDVDEVMRHL
jgi:hypothetical protein